MQIAKIISIFMKIFSVHHADGITKFVVNGKNFPFISNVVFGEGVRR